MDSHMGFSTISLMTGSTHLIAQIDHVRNALPPDLWEHQRIVRRMMSKPYS